MLIVLIIAIAIIIFIIFFNNVKEDFYDIIPRVYLERIYTSSSMPELRRTSYECYKWCNNWAEPGGSEGCRLKCLDEGDIQSDNLKFNSYNFYDILPHVAYKLLDE